MSYDSDLLDAHFATVLPGRNLPAISRNERGNTTSSPTSQEPDSLKLPKNSSITTESLDKSKLHDESILSFTAQGSEVTSPSRRKTKSVSKARTGLKSKSGYFTQLSENSVASKKTANNFEPYIKSISPLNEFPKLVFESAQCKTSLITSSLESTNDSNSHSKFILPCKEFHKFKFECSQPKTSSNTTISGSANDSNSHSKFTLPFKEPHKFQFEPKTSSNATISGCANDSNSHSKFTLPVKDPHKLFDFSQPKASSNTTISGSANDSNSHSKFTLPFKEPHKLQFEPKTSSNATISGSANDSNSHNIVDSKYSKNSLITEYGNVFKSNRYITSHVCEDKDEFPDDTQQYNRNISKLVSNSKVAPIQAYQLCLVLKDSPVSYILESASNEFGQESGYVFDLPISYPAIDDDLKIHAEIVKAGNEEENLNKEALANGVPVPADDIHQPVDNITQSLDDAPVSSAHVYESDDDVCQMMKSIYGNIHYLKKVLDDVEKNSELIGKELGLPPLCISEIVTGCSTVPKTNFNPSYFINTYGNKPFTIEKHKKHESSLAIRYFKNERQNTVSPMSNFSKESVEEKSSMLPFETNLLLIDSILLRLQNTYKIVQREVSSWSTVHETDSTGTKFKNGSLSTTEDGCLANALKCLMKFKDRRGSTSVKGIGRRFSDSGSSFSLINNKIRRRTGKVSSAEKMCSFLEKGINNRSSIAKHYESVWILSSSDSDEVDGPVDNEISNDTEKISAAENDSLSKNSKCILKFKGRHASASRGKYNDFDSSSSDSDEMTGQSENESSNQSERKSPVEMCSFSNKGGHTEISEGSYYDCVKISSHSGELNDHTDDKMDESEVDDSESSLEGSFKNFRTSSRLLSPISSGDDSKDSSADDVPRFSLPPPKTHAKKFYSKKTDLLEQVSCKEWSLKKGETEISFKCTQRGRRFRSDERCIRDSQGITEEFWQDDLEIPSDLLQDSSQFPTIK
ncbi:hypothetical protein JTE90_018420 [Oedothorax gibbosus]|uniref:Uncharacterized protein n=1 Tax=Oedothorax gibbosus TaxID=931172 RepID=A0AAV6TY67_9ARAC|nr:hypothetical protein JTE90_018420 [Oedothorax gibbosus]